MRRNWSGEPCCVPGCYRRAKKEISFCERCWSTAEDGERAMVQFAQFAPCYPTYIRVDADVAPRAIGRTVKPGQQDGAWVYVHSEDSADGYLFFGSEPMGALLRDFEARSTREAVALAIAARRRLCNELIAEGEDA